MKQKRLTAKQYKATAPEVDIQAHVLEYIRLNHVDHAFAFAIPNAGKRGRGAQAQIKREGILAGAADVVVLMPGAKTGWLEMKSAKGRTSLAQELFGTLCMGLGHPYAVVHSFDEAVAILKKWGAVR